MNLTFSEIKAGPQELRRLNTRKLVLMSDKNNTCNFAQENRHNNTSGSGKELKLESIFLLSHDRWYTGNETKVGRCRTLLSCFQCCNIDNPILPFITVLSYFINI